jgi:hypothetical protein
MGKRRDRFDRRKVEQATTRRKNGPRKADERARRDARMREELKAGTLPYTRAVRSWLTAQLGKKEHQITQDDVRRLLQSQEA